MDRVSSVARPAISAAWARDSCRCDECRDAGSDQHLIDVADVAGWEVVSQERSARETVITLERAGERHRCVIPDSVAGTNERMTWTSTHGSYLREHAVAPSDASTFATQLASTGICLVEGVSIQSEAVLAFAESVGFVRETNYGRLFDVLAVPEPNNLAYSDVALPLHTDNPYREPCPTVQLLHCLQSAASGGATQLSDGFHAANALRETYPAFFDVLRSTELRFRFHDATVDLATTRPMIAVNNDGEVVAVSVNHRSMEAPNPTVADDFYRAYAKFTEIIRDGQIELMLDAGDLIAFDNRRVLHARSGFDRSEGRHLQGCYIDMDNVRSVAQMSRLGRLR